MFLLIALGVVLFLASLPFPAVYYERVSHPGLFYLALGWIGPLGLHVGWYANPLLPVAWLAAALPGPVASRIATVAAYGAAFLCLTSYLTLFGFTMIGENEGATAGEFVFYGPGIALWTGSVATSVLAARASASGRS